MKEFDFENIGKRHPYRTPDDFFDTLEDKVMQRVAETKKHQLKHRVVKISLTMFAAAVLLLALIPLLRPTQDIVSNTNKEITAQIEKVEVNNKQVENKPSTLDDKTGITAKIETKEKQPTRIASVTAKTSQNNLDNWSDEEIDEAVAMIEDDPFLNCDLGY